MYFFSVVYHFVYVLLAECTVMTFIETNSRKLSNPRTCLELALEAERICKTTRDYATAIRLFRQALAVGTDDIAVLSAIYSQLGNAYFYQHDFLHALEFHRWDLSLSRQTGDLHGEAKACANLSTCFKMIDKYSESVFCAKRQLEICRRFNDMAAIARALHNLGNAYHAKGRQFIQFSGVDHLGEFTSEAKQDQERALACFQENLALVCKLGDRSSEGRAYGNLGNTHYLLGNFREAVELHKKRLQIAKEFGDLRAQRRAYSNLGNAYIFLAEFGAAARSYKHALGIARQLGDETLQAQACFSLGHSCTLLRDYSAAVVYYLRHLHSAWEARDLVGQGRCQWSLANVYAALGDYQRALRSSLRHRKISAELKDEIGLLASDLMISELKRIIGDSNQSNPPVEGLSNSQNRLQAAAEARALEQVLLFDADNSQGQSQSQAGLTVLAVSPSVTTTSNYKVVQPCELEVQTPLEQIEELSERELDEELSLATSAAMTVRQKQGEISQENGTSGEGVELLSLSEEDEEDFVVVVSPSEPDMSNDIHYAPVNDPPNQSPNAANQSDSSELLLDLLFKSQALRMNDQRCDLNAVTDNNDDIDGNGNGFPNASRDSLNSENDSFLELLINLQGARMNDQRAEFPGLIRTTITTDTIPSATPPGIVNNEDVFGNGVQRNASLQTSSSNNATSHGSASGRLRSASDGLTEGALSAGIASADQVPSAADELEPGDDFFDMIFRLQQRTRINDQRSVLPSVINTTNGHNNHHQHPANPNHQDVPSITRANDNSNSCHSNGNCSSETTPHGLLQRVLSVPGGSKKRRRPGNSNAGGGTTKASVA
nr:G protein signaling modulator 2 [Hymenolepis microstoma]